MKRAGNIWLVLVAIVLAVSMLALPSCDSGEDFDGPEIESYTIADNTGDWGYPSPYAHYARGPGLIRMQFIFETLVWKNDKEFVPQLASEWSYDEKENSYTFKLQENVKWHNGADFTADDVVFTYNYTKEHPYALVDNSIVESAEALDTYTVKLYLSQPYAPFFQDVAGTQPILPKHIWEDVAVPEEFLTPEAVVGTGPYVFADYHKEHGTYLYEASDNYYLGEPAVEEIKFVKISSEMTPAALQNQMVNAGRIPAEVKDDMEAAGFTILADRPSSNVKLTINHHEEPLSSAEFRQALAYAIDREDLVQIVLRGHGLAGSPGIIPPTSDWYNPGTPQYEYSAEKARQLIEGLGYSRLDNGYYAKNGQILTLSLIAAADYKDLGQFITQQLEQIGIDIDFQTLEGKTVDSKVEAWDFELSIYGHGGLYEPSIFDLLVLGEHFNSARYTSNDTLTQLVEGQLTEMDPEKRKEMVFQIQEIYAGELPTLTLYYPSSYWAHDGTLALYHTTDGVALGCPIPLNRMCFVKQ